MGHRKYAIVAVILSAFLPARLPAATNADIQQLIAASTSGSLSQLQPSLDAQTQASVRDLKRIDPSRVIAVASCREFTRYFGAIPAPTAQQREVLSWLAAQPRLMPTLMSAVARDDPPARVLNLLQILGAPRNKTLDQFPDFTTAMIVVWDKQQPKDDTRVRLKFDPAHFVSIFNHFTGGRAPLRFRLADLSWQLDLYIADIKVSDEEMQWAANRYANNFSIGSLYFDVNYDERAFYQGDAKKIAGRDYTLPNILQVGGVCVEQAYFAEEVAKTLGIPACMCSSRGGGAGQAAHAWLGILTLTNNQYAWDFNQGRYSDDLFWSADITDPQTHEILTDADVGLLADLQKVDRDTRLLSTFLLKIADLLPPAQHFELATREIEVCPGNRVAWNSIADLGSKNQLSPPQTQAVDGLVDRYLLNSYPDFACQTLMRLVSGQSTSDQVNSLDRVAQAFPARPDLRARVRLHQADLLLAVHHDDDAFRALNDVLTNDINAGAIILQAMRRTDKLMRAHNNLPGLARVYAQTWPRMPVPERSSYVYHTPYYVVGRAYMALLESLKDAATAEDVRNRLIAVIPAGAQLE